MSIKITINGSEVKNPLAKFIVTLLSLLGAFLFLLIILFMVFPLIWFFWLSVIILIVAVVLLSPRIFRQYKSTVIQRKTLSQDKMGR